MLSKEAKEAITKDGFKIYRVQDNIYVLVKSETKQSQLHQKSTNREKELNLLWKISKMDYKQRNIKRVKSILTPEEQRMLDNMLKRKIIYLHKQTIAFPEQLYEQLKELSRIKYLKEKDIDYEILTPEEFKEFMKRDDFPKYTYILSYDGTYYIIKTDLLRRILEKMEKLKIQRISPSELAKLLGISEKLSTIILKIMAEQGEFAEVEPNVYEKI